MPSAVGDVDAERDRPAVIVWASVVQETDVASQGQSQLILAVVAVDGEERGFGVTCGRIVEHDDRLTAENKQDVSFQCI